MYRKLETAEEFILGKGNEWAKQKLNPSPGLVINNPEATVVASAAMVAAVQRFDRSSGLARWWAAIWNSRINLRSQER